VVKSEDKDSKKKEKKKETRRTTNHKTMPNFDEATTHMTSKITLRCPIKTFPISFVSLLGNGTPWRSYGDQDALTRNKHFSKVQPVERKDKTADVVTASRDAVRVARKPSHRPEVRPR